MSEAPAAAMSYDSAFAALNANRQAARRQYSHVRTSNERFNDWVNRSVADIQMMVTDTPYGPYPYAGVPWFNTVFGRDGIITALELLWLNPELAHGVLASLAATQATEVAPERMPSQARFCTRRAAAKWRRSARCRSGGTTEASMRRRSF